MFNYFQFNSNTFNGALFLGTVASREAVGFVINDTPRGGMIIQDVKGVTYYDAPRGSNINGPLPIGNIIP